MSKPRKLRERPAGYRGCQAVIERREKAWQVAYYGWALWIPIKALCEVDGALWAAMWAIESAKKHSSAREIVA